VRVDGSGNAGGFTTFWSYTDAAQVPGDGYIYFHCRGLSNAIWVTVTDRYPLNGMIPPSPPYSGTFAGPGPAISDTPTRTAAAISCVRPPAGLVAWWPGEGSARDVIGGKDGVLQSGVTFAPGQVGEAFSFSGAAYVQVPVLDLSAFEGASFEAWIKPANVTTNRYYEILRQEWTNPDPDWLISFQEFGTILSFGLNAGGSYEELDVPISAGDYVDGNWHLITATYDGATKRLFRDGMEIGSAPKSGKIRFAGVGQAIGAVYVPGFTAEYFDGLIDEVTIFNRALAPGEIAAIHGAANAGM
jgi:hypothetical protein